ncbi:VOC family protein [Halobacillus yeomjeoni]|uniref:VOC family protein n=1 Tax=Halobacillus yeomjeoni TaxID=311194 RepID=A0A931HXD2_9BACI|nr:VOC family protein [Halobacillus yeomjeoni]MBH0231228.1 VOC family protein [Halobacillus yeomjeoni]
MAKLYPYLFCKDARAQADFYIKSLGGEIESVQTYDEMPDPDPALEGRVMHLVLQAGGIRIFMADAANQEIEPGTNIDLTLEFTSVEEAEKAFGGLSEGGDIFMPFEKMFWGDYFGRFQDRYGVRWQISVSEE